MPSGPPEPQRPTAVGFLLSHHVPERYDRTLSIPGTRGSVHLCARCSGQLAGAAALLAFVAFGIVARGPLFSPQVQVWFAIAPVVPAVDWVLQAVRGAESTNLRRVLSGAFLGVALLDAVLLAATAHWLFLAIAVAVFLLYAVSITAILVVSGAWRVVLSEHFPGISLPPG